MVSDEEARAAAQEILAQHSFTRWNNEFESWLRAFEGLVDLIPSGLIEALAWLYRILIEDLLLGFLSGLAEILRRLGIFGDSPTALGWFALGVFVAAGIVLAYRIRASTRDAEASSALDETTARTHSDSIGAARALAARGQFLEAAHRVQLATLARLIESDLLALSRSDPNRTLRRRVADSALPEYEQHKLIELVDRLESLWFDEPREDRELFDEWMALDSRLLRRVPRGRG